MGDPTGGWSATGRSPGLLLRSQMGRFETKWLAGLRTSPLSPICPDGWQGSLKSPIMASTPSGIRGMLDKMEDTSC